VYAWRGKRREGYMIYGVGSEWGLAFCICSWIRDRDRDTGVKIAYLAWSGLDCCVWLDHACFGFGFGFGYHILSFSKFNC
jgi:hypothetical protein